jgi:hypothetical protein
LQDKDINLLYFDRWIYPFFVYFTEKEQMQPPRFVERIQNFNIREGQPVTLRCQVIGIPQPMISWQKDGRMLVPNKPYR